MEMTTAPTLQELPPEKGTILELHSINEEYNGMLVVYHSVNKDNGKFIVNTLKEDSDEMHVKARVCRRPALKPLKLRKTLASLVQAYQQSFRSPEQVSVEEAEAKLKSFVAKDPCCVPAYLSLGQFVYGGYIKSKQIMANENRMICDAEASDFVDYGATVHHIRIALANMYAYEGLVSETAVNNCKSVLSTCLVQLGRPKSATRFEPRGDNMMDEFHYGRSLFENAKKLRNKERFERERQDLLSSFERMMKVLDAAVKGRYICSTQRNQDEIVRASLEISIEIINRFYEHLCAKMQTALFRLGIPQDASQDTILRASIHHGKTADPSFFPLNENVVHLIDDLFSACTSQNGVVKFLNDFQQKNMNNFRDACMKFVKAGQVES